jgi:hypothetical protein
MGEYPKHLQEVIAEEQGGVDIYEHYDIYEKIDKQNKVIKEWWKVLSEAESVIKNAVDTLRFKHNIFKDESPSAELLELLNKVNQALESAKKLEMSRND